MQNVKAPIYEFGQGYGPAPAFQGQPQVPQPQVFVNPDVYSQLQAKLAYKRDVQALELMEKAQTLEMKATYERQHFELMASYRAYLQLIGCTIYQNSAGDLICAMTGPDGKTILSRRLLSVKHFKSEILRSNSGGETFMKLIWDSADNAAEKCNCSCYYSLEKHSNRKFLRKLQENGINLLVSGRTESQAVAALYAYCFSNSQVKHLPEKSGWTKDESGNWRYIAKDVLTVEKVRKCMTK